MGLFAGIGRWIVRTLFVLSIALFLVASTGAHFSEKENLKGILKEAAATQIDEQTIAEMTRTMQTACQQNNNQNLEKYFSEVNQTISIDCRKISENYSRELFSEQVVGSLVDKIYSEKCDGLQCLISNPAKLATEYAHNILQNLEIITFAIVLVFGLLLVLITPGISGKLFSLGYIVLAAGIPYFLIPAIKIDALKSLPAGSGASGEKIVDMILSYLSDKFLIMLIIGAVLVGIGFIIKLTIEKGGKKKS